MSDLVFKTAAKREHAEVVEFTLDDDTYHFTAPKRFPLWLATNESLVEQIRVQLNWLSAGLPDEEAARLLARFNDFDDDLGVEELVDVVRGLTEETAGRPTTPSPD